MHKDAKIIELENEVELLKEQLKITQALLSTYAIDDDYVDDAVIDALVFGTGEGG